MFNPLRLVAAGVRKLRSVSPWFPLSQVPAGFLGGPSAPGAVYDPEAALTVSPFWCGIRLYASTVGSLPLVAYRKGEDGERERAEDDAAYRVLHDRPNPAMSRAVFWDLVTARVFLDGEAFIQVRRTEGGELVGLYPIPKESVRGVVVDAEWHKTYLVDAGGTLEALPDEEVIHLFMHSRDGFRGVPVLDYAGESMGLHRQVITSAGAFYKNAARPSGYLKYPKALSKDAVETIKKWFKEEYAGEANTGKLPVTADGGEFVRFPGVTAEDAQIIQALSASVDDVARWLNVSPLMLWNLQRGTYSNLAADNQAFYQRSIRPLLDRFEQELNEKVFGAGSDLYAEFLTEAILRGSPEQQAAVFHSGLIDGYYTRAEVRRWLNLPKLPGLDKPLMPQNMVTVSAEAAAVTVTTADQVPTDEATLAV